MVPGTCAPKLDLRLDAEGAYDVAGAREAPVTSTAQVPQLPSCIRT